MAEQSYELMHKDDVVASLQLDDLSGAIKMALTVWFVSAIDLLYSFFSLRNVLPQSILGDHPKLCVNLRCGVE